MRRAFRVGAVALAATALVTACDGGGGHSASTSPAPLSSSTPTTNPPASTTATSASPTGSHPFDPIPGLTAEALKAKALALIPKGEYAPPVRHGQELIAAVEYDDPDFYVHAITWGQGSDGLVMDVTCTDGKALDRKLVGLLAFCTDLAYPGSNPAQARAWFARAAAIVTEDRTAAGRFAGMGWELRRDTGAFPQYGLTVGTPNTGIGDCARSPNCTTVAG